MAKCCPVTPNKNFQAVAHLVLSGINNKHRITLSQSATDSAKRDTIITTLSDYCLQQDAKDVINFTFDFNTQLNS